MVGTKRHSGGKREGAGRKPGSFRLKIGDAVAVRNVCKDGITPLETGEVTEIERNRITIRLANSEIVIIR